MPQQYLGSWEENKYGQVSVHLFGSQSLLSNYIFANKTFLVHFTFPHLNLNIFLGRCWNFFIFICFNQIKLFVFITITVHSLYDINLFWICLSMICVCNLKVKCYKLHYSHYKLYDSILHKINAILQIRINKKMHN